MTVGLSCRREMLGPKEIAELHMSSRGHSGLEGKATPHESGLFSIQITNSCSWGGGLLVGSHPQTSDWDTPAHK
ncbi:hypothetical protein CRENBAI_023072 [Crenichthys baileyi]|uniref:Uncharacterized protein n=1 Tax=Crenichthys baileyi TaxID=28760 RepID=A0AAV9RPQ5_9TELE